MAIAILLLLALLDLASGADAWTWPQFWSQPGRYFADHFLVANISWIVLVFAIGWILVAGNRAVKRDQIDRDVTSVGLGGTVLPLLEIEFVLRRLAQGTPGQAGLIASRQPGKPLKWVRPLLTAGESGAAAPPTRQTTPSQPTAEHPQPVAGRDDIAGLLNESLRKVVAALRDWADLLVFSERGRHAMHAAHSLRTALQELEDAVAADSGPRRACGPACPELRAAFSDLADEALFQAVMFEFASMSIRPRRELLCAAAGWAERHSIVLPEYSPEPAAILVRANTAAAWLSASSDTPTARAPMQGCGDACHADASDVPRSAPSSKPGREDS